MNGAVINENATLLNHIINMAQAQYVRHVPANAGQHNFQGIVKLLDDLAQGDVDQALAEVKRGRDCRLCLLRQNPNPHPTLVIDFFGVGFQENPYSMRPADR